jgi:hypothetical protein
MVRALLTRLVDSPARIVLLVPCLLICLACATPFPIEKLQEGMTTEMVREKFGEPESIETGGGFFWDSCWRYIHEQQRWFVTLNPMALLLVPVFRFIPPHLVGGDTGGDSRTRWDYIYVYWRPVQLHFEGEELVSWELVETVWEGSPRRVVDSGPPVRWEGGYSEAPFSRLTCKYMGSTRP